VQMQFGHLLAADEMKVLYRVVALGLGVGGSAGQQDGGYYDQRIDVIFHGLNVAQFAATTQKISRYRRSNIDCVPAFSYL
jgi:hypothetical protein